MPIKKMFSQAKKNAGGLVTKFQADMKRKRQDSAYKSYRKRTASSRKNIQRDKEMAKYGSNSIKMRGTNAMKRHKSGKSLESKVLKKQAKKLRRSL